MRLIPEPFLGVNGSHFITEVETKPLIPGRGWKEAELAADSANGLVDI
jgi:hypothetical protein